jgi:hypothetical protein
MQSKQTQDATRRRLAGLFAIVAALTLALGSGNALAAPAKPKPKPRPMLTDITINKPVDRPSPGLSQ